MFASAGGRPPADAASADRVAAWRTRPGPEERREDGVRAAGRSRDLRRRVDREQPRVELEVHVAALEDTAHVVISAARERSDVRGGVDAIGSDLAREARDLHRGRAVAYDKPAAALAQ